MNGMTDERMAEAKTKTEVNKKEIVKIMKE